MGATTFLKGITEWWRPKSSRLKQAMPLQFIACWRMVSGPAALPYSHGQCRREIGSAIFGIGMGGDVDETIRNP
jgi:hypothetical protein